MSSDMVLLGEIVRPHGVRGEVKLRSFTAEPCDIGAYGVLVTDRGEKLTLKSVRAAQDHVIARIEGVADRDAAERLKGRKLQVERESLPDIEDDDEMYIADLVGLAVVDAQGRRLGEVVALQNYGAGDLLEVAVEGRRSTVLLPYTDDVVLAETDTAVVIEAGEGSVAAAFFAPVGNAPQDDGIDVANDNPDLDGGAS